MLKQLCLVILLSFSTISQSSESNASADQILQNKILFEKMHLGVIALEISLHPELSCTQMSDWAHKTFEENLPLIPSTKIGKWSKLIAKVLLLAEHTFKNNNHQPLLKVKTLFDGVCEEKEVSGLCPDSYRDEILASQRFSNYQELNHGSFYGLMAGYVLSAHDHPFKEASKKDFIKYTQKLNTLIQKDIYYILQPDLDFIKEQIRPAKKYPTLFQINLIEKLLEKISNEEARRLRLQEAIQKAQTPLINPALRRRYMTAENYQEEERPKRITFAQEEKTAATASSSATHLSQTLARFKPKRTKKS